MPNWCNNTITISGPKAKIKAVWDQANQQDGGLLSAMSPPPENMFKGSLGQKEQQECLEQGIPNWYDWQSSNWGTKWDVSTEGLEYVEDGETATITGWFDSAWAPPIGAYDTFTAANPDCSVDALYEEGGMDFAGHYADGQDDYIDGVSDYARAKIIRGDSGSDVYDRLDGELELTEARREYIQEELNEDAQKVHDLVVEKRAQNMEHKIDG
jgi:hypothetical protein